MAKQLQDNRRCVSKKRWVLFVLFFSIALLSAALLLIETKSILGNTTIAGFLIVAAILLIVLDFWLLMKEMTKTIIENRNPEQQKLCFGTSLNSITEGLITTGRNAEILFMNTAAERITGWENGEVKNLPLQKVYNVESEEKSRPFENIVSRILREGRTIEMENNTILNTKNADQLIIANSGSPFFDANGNIAGSIVVFSDVTEKKKIETKLYEREKQYRDLIQNLPVAVYTCDEFGYIQLYNKAAVALWGREPVAGNDQWCGSWKIFTTDAEAWPIDTCPMAITLKEQRAVHGEQIIIQRPDGSKHHVLPYPTPLFDANGKLTGAVNMLIDITDKKEKEILVKQTEEKYRNLFEQASDAIVAYSLDGTIYEFNQAVYNILGYTKEEFKKLNLQDILVGEIVINPVNVEKMRRGETVLFNRTIKRKDGMLVEVEINSREQLNGHILAIVRDISEKKLAEEAIRESNERYELATKATSDMVWDWNFVTGEVHRSKEGWKRIFKSELDNCIGNEEGWQLKIHPDDKERVTQIKEDIINSAEKNFFEIECRVLRDDNSIVYILDKGYIIRNEEGRAVRLVGATQDITEKKKVEEELKKLSIIAKQTSNAVIITDIEDRITWVNEAFTRMTEYELTEVIGKRPGDFLQGPATNPAVVRLMRRKVAALAPFESDIINYTKSGKKHWVRIQCQPEFDASGKVTGFFSIQTDITKEKEAEEAIKSSEEKYRYLFDNNASSIMIWDLDNLGILEVNENATKQYGYSREEFLQLNLLNLRLPEDHSRIKELAEQLKSDSAIKPAGHWKHINKAGEIMYMFIVSHSIYFKGRRVIMTMSDNVTEKIKLEQQLETEKIKKQQEITEAVISAQEKERQHIGRELHDNINQILVTSRLYLGMAKTDENNKAGLMEETDGLINAAINEIRVLSHSLVPPSLNESELLEALEDIINKTQRMTGITIHKEITDIDENTISDKFKLTLFRIVQEQFSNIIKYAATKTICLKLCQENKKIVLSIKDEGVGFDPTKKVTGIGLMNMKTRASLFNGEVSIISSPGHGCEVQVVFSDPQKTVLPG